MSKCLKSMKRAQKQKESKTETSDVKKVSELLGKGKFQDKGKEPEPIISVVATEATKTLADHPREMPRIPANISKNCIDLFLKKLSKYLCHM